MRPYLAIIKDSFHEALASRVLWVLLLLITVLLLVMAPVGYREELTKEFRADDFRNARVFAETMMQEFDGGEATPGYRIVGMLPVESRDLLRKFGSGESQPGSAYYLELNQVTAALNKLLEKRDLYEEANWANALLGSEARELLERERNELTDDELARLNRLLIETPYEEYFRPQPPKQIAITYLGMKTLPPFRYSERRVKQAIELVVVPLMLEFLLGPIGLLSAIVVTASIIPLMFDSGSLSLLLSKPLSRSLMFLAKFTGGCAFILINASYFFAGLWLLMGWRLGIWNNGFLLCIPIFLFLFAVYYSVSALVGVVWRNAIICVVMTVLFWATCFGVGTLKNVFDAFLVETKKIVQVVEAGDTLVTINERGQADRWNPDTEQWEQIFLEGNLGNMRRVLGPVYDAGTQTLMAAQFGHRLFQSQNSLLVGREQNGWMQVEGPALPEDTFELLPDPRGRLLAVSFTGVQELVGDVETKEKVKVFFMEIPQTFEKPFRTLGPQPALELASPAVAAVDRQTSNLVIYSRGKLMLLERGENEYSVAKEVTVDADEDQGAGVAVVRSTVLLALGDGRLLNYSVPDLQLREKYQPEKYSEARFVCASPDGKWLAIVFHNAKLHLLNVEDPEQPKLQIADVRGQGTLSAAAFTNDGCLLVADRTKRVVKYELGSFARQATFAPLLTFGEKAYYYVLEPIYKVFPKPSEMDNTIRYALKQEETVGDAEDLQAIRGRVRPWDPVISSMIFMAVLLAISCVYIEWQEF